MSFNKFKLLHETADKFHLEHPSGKKFEVHKSKLTPAAMKKIQGLADGGGVKSLQELPAAQEEDLLRFLHGSYPDTGRVASSPAERFDSMSGAPVRAGIKAAQEGRFADVLSEMYRQFNADPQKTVPPTGEELVKAAGVTNPYLAKGLGLGLEIASDPSTYIAGRMPIPGVVGGVINASKRFPKKATAAQTKKIQKAEVLDKTLTKKEITEPTGELIDVAKQQAFENQQRDLYNAWAKATDFISDLHYGPRQKLSDFDLKKIKELKPILEQRVNDFPHDYWAKYFNNNADELLKGYGGTNKPDVLPGFEPDSPIYQYADDLGIRIKSGNFETKSKQGIHVSIEPGENIENRLTQALDDASKDNFHSIYVYQKPLTEVIEFKPQSKTTTSLLEPGEVKQYKTREQLDDEAYMRKREQIMKEKSKAFQDLITQAKNEEQSKSLKSSTADVLKFPKQSKRPKKPIKEAHGGMIPGYVNGGTVQSFAPVPGPAPTPSPEPIPSVDASNVVSEALNVKPETIYSEEQRKIDLEQKIKNRTDVLSAAVQARQFGQELTPQQQASIGDQVRQELIGEQKAQQVIGQAETQQARDMLVKENQQRVALGLPPKPLPAGFAPDQQMMAEGQARALPGTAPSVSPLTEKMRTMGDVFTMQELGAEKALGQIDEGLRRTQKAYDDYILDMKAQQVLDTPQDIAARYREKDDALIKYLDENKINPDRYMQNMSTGNRILSAIGLILGGAGGGASGRNVALDTLNRAIDHDIRAQELDRSEKMNLLKMNREMMADEIQASVATRNQMFSLAQAKIQQAQAMTSNAQTKLQLLGLYADIEKQKAQNRLQLALLQGGQGSDSLENADPSRLVGMMIQNPADRSTAFKEVQAAQNTVKMKKAIMESFEQAAKENTVLKTGAGFIRTPGSVLALHQHMMPTFVDLEGSATEGKIHATLKNITPQPGDSEYTIGQKRRMLLEYLQSKASAPVTNAYGINLQNFASTSHNPVMSMSPRERQYYNYAMRYPNSPVSIDFKRKMGIE